MGLISNYIRSYLDKKRYYKNVSFFSFWDRNTDFAAKIYIAHGVKLSKVIIGKYTRVRHFSTIHVTKIGSFTSISRNARIGLAEHPTNLLSTNSLFYSHVPNEIRSDWVRDFPFEERKPVVIGSDVWIGEFVTVKGGISIGDGAVVAARSVVTKNVPPYAIVAGVPARIIRYRFNDEIINKLLKIKWWNLNDDEIEEKLEVFSSTEITNEFLEKFFFEEGGQKN